MKQQSSWTSLAGLKTKKRYVALALASVMALAGCDNTDDTTKKEVMSPPQRQKRVPKRRPLQNKKQAAPKLSNEELVKNMPGKIWKFWMPQNCNLMVRAPWW